MGNGWGDALKKYREDKGLPVEEEEESLGVTGVAKGTAQRAGGMMLQFMGAAGQRFGEGMNDFMSDMDEANESMTRRRLMDAADPVKERFKSLRRREDKREDNLAQRAGDFVRKSGEAISRAAPEDLPWAAGVIGDAAGSMAAMVAMGGTSPAMISQFGGLAGSRFFGDEAKQAGADPETVKRAEQVGYFFGLLEIAGIKSKWIPLPSSVKNKILGHAISGGAAESFQETIMQNVPQNLAAQILFDPERSLLEGTPESMLGGAAIGTPTGALTRGGQAVPDKKELESKLHPTLKYPGAAPETEQPILEGGRGFAPVEEITEEAPVVEERRAEPRTEDSDALFLTESVREAELKAGVEPGTPLSKEQIMEGGEVVREKIRSGEIRLGETKEPVTVEFIPEEGKGSRIQEMTAKEGIPEEEFDVPEIEALQEGRPTPEEVEAEEAEIERITQMSAFPGEIGSDIKEMLDARKPKQRDENFEQGAVPSESALVAADRIALDKLAMLGKAQDIVPPQSDESNAYQKHELMRGKQRQALKEADDALIEPLLKHIRRGKLRVDSKLDLEAEEVDFGLALAARTAPERNALVKKRREGEMEAGSGLTNEQAAQVMLRIQKSPKRKAYEEGFFLFDKLTRATRQNWVRYGLESQETVDALEGQFEFYAPLKTHMDVEGLGIGRGVHISGREFQAALGRMSLPDNPLAFALVQHQQSILRGEKNRVSQAFGKWIEENQGEIKGLAKHIKGVTKKAKLAGGIVKDVPDPSMMNQDNVLAYKVDGKTKFIQFDEQHTDLAKNLKNIGGPTFDPITRFLTDVVEKLAWWNPLGLAARTVRTVTSGKGSRFLAQAYTRWNPVFPIFNMIRDVGTGTFNSLEHGAKFAASVLRDVPAAISVQLGKNKDPKWAEYYERYKKSGAPISFLDLKSMKETEKDIRRQLKEESTGTIAGARRSWRKLLDLLGAWSDLTENASRISAFKNAIEQLGMTDEQAAYYAKNLTTNFEKKGEIGNVLNSNYLFANAGMQGTKRVAQALKFKNVRRVVLSGMAGMMAWDQICRLAMGQDDDGEDHYDKIPWYIKRSNLVIPGFGGDGDYFTIPLPFVYSFFHDLAIVSSSTLSGDMKPSDAVAEIGMAALDSFNPLGGTAEPADVITPVWADPVVQLATNRDGLGRTIAPENPYGPKGPDSQRFWPDVNPWVKAISEKMNEWTGGDKYEAGLIDISPETLEHLAQFATGGLGSTVMRTLTIKERVEEGEPIRPFEIPLIRRLYREKSPFRNKKRFDESLEELETEEARAKGEGQAMDPNRRGLLREARRVQRKVSDLMSDMQEKTVREQEKIFEEADRLWQDFLRRAKQ